MTQADDAARSLQYRVEPEERDGQTYPKLDQEAARRIAQYGVEEMLPAGTILFERGQRGIDFFFVLDGSIEIFDRDMNGHVSIIAIHRESQFSGELDLFNDRAVLLGGRTGAASRIVRLDHASFRRMLSNETDLSEIIMRAFILRRVKLIRDARGGVVVLGAGHSGDTLRVQRFLTRNGFPHRLLDTDRDPDAASMLRTLNIQDVELPVVVTADKLILRNPSVAQLAHDLGMAESIDAEHIYDLAVIGAGPAGLAAAVYAASEGLDTIVIESIAPGGQAGTSSKIENYLGFPTGISGQALAGRAQAQAQKFGARLIVSREATNLDCNGQPFLLHLQQDGAVRSRSLVIATGARYRKLSVPNFEKFEGQGIHYAATAMEAQLCENEEVVVVGGGNSAGQAAMFLSRTASHVHILVRAKGLAATMSDYLVRRITGSTKVTLHTYAEITDLEGDKYLRSVTWANRVTGESETHHAGNLFVMIGADPNTDWLSGCLDLDDKGFIRTGYMHGSDEVVSPYATSRPGVYAVGDVRSGSVKRVASGVGEGSVVVQAIHGYLDPSHS